MLSRNTTLQLGREFWNAWEIDVHETVCLMDPREGVVLLNSPYEVSAWLKSQIEYEPQRPIAYVTGKFDCGPHHLFILQRIAQQGWRLILGLEPDQYFTEHDRQPNFNMQTRVNYWLRQIGPPAAIFTVPKETTDYDSLSRQCNTYRHPNVIHIGSTDDIGEIKIARQGRAYSPWHYVEMSVHYNGTFKVFHIHPSEMVHMQRFTNDV